MEKTDGDRKKRGAETHVAFIKHLSGWLINTFFSEAQSTRITKSIFSSGNDITAGLCFIKNMCLGTILGLRADIDFDR